MKQCSKCNEIKEITEFYKRKDSKDGYRNDCKKCRQEVDTKKRRSTGVKEKRVLFSDGIRKECSKCGVIKEFAQFNTNIMYKDGHCYSCRECSIKVDTKRNRANGMLPMGVNRVCSSYLGVAVAERLIRHLFSEVQSMPYGNSGYDFICSKNKKIDIKSACITLHHKKNPWWTFHIRRNKIADYFLLLAFNNRVDLEPVHQWLIPGHVLNHLTGATISPSTIDKWDEYRQPIGPAITCCNTIKGL